MLAGLTQLWGHRMGGKEGGDMLTGPDRTLKTLLPDQDQVHTSLDETYIFSV